MKLMITSINRMVKVELVEGPYDANEVALMVTQLMRLIAETSDLGFEAALKQLVADCIEIVIHKIMNNERTIQ